MPRNRGAPVLRRRLPGLCLPPHVIRQRPPLLWRRLPFCVSVAAGRVALIHVSRCRMHSPLHCQSPRLAIGSANAIRAACQLRIYLLRFAFASALSPITASASLIAAMSPKDPYLLGSRGMLDIAKLANARTLAVSPSLAIAIA